MATITEALKIENGWAEKVHEVCKDELGSHPTVSDSLEAIGAWVRDEDLASDHQLTVYEKKLLFAGYVAGSMHAIKQHEQAMMAMELLKMLKGKDGDGPDLEDLFRGFKGPRG
jgi:hypothetical protein